MLTKRNFLIYGALVGTVLLSWHMAKQDAELVQQTALVQPARYMAITARLPAAQLAGAADDFSLQPRQPVVSQADLFHTPAQQRPAMHTASARVTTESLPPLPFKYLGLWQQRDERKVLLESAGEVLTVSVGEKINEQYQLQEIQQNAQATQVKILYLPVHKTQVLLLEN